MSEVDQLNEQLEEEQAARSQIQQKLQKALSDANAMKGQLDVEGAGRLVGIFFIFLHFFAFLFMKEVIDCSCRLIRLFPGVHLTFLPYIISILRVFWGES